jgi:hypothetical protein
MQTVYQVAQDAMNVQIAHYLELIKATEGLANIEEQHLAEPAVAMLFAAGIDTSIPEDFEDAPRFLIAEFKRKPAVLFDVEVAICAGVYSVLREHAIQLYRVAAALSANFSKFDPATLKANPHVLPILQNALRLSKALLKKKVGSVSDNAISGAASKRLAVELAKHVGTNAFEEETVLRRVEITLEGIVRDLVGRVLLEEVVAHALSEQGINFLREHEYPSIGGVVYDFRADFVLPDNVNPMAFIEVRKSSSRHASLYAKDKMFSAINWKGKHKKLIGVVVVEGQWTQATLKTMANVFDYVVPLSKAAELAKVLKQAQDGDESVLRWIVDFSISSSPNYAKGTL